MMNTDTEGSVPALILVIEDDAEIRKYLRETLVTNKYRVAEAETGKEGLLHFKTRQPDLILLDLGLPDQDGKELIKELRTYSLIPIIVLSARGLEEDKVKALDLGADDYISKPFGPKELLARIRVSLRHSANNKTEDGKSLIEIRELRINLTARRVTFREQEVHLSPLEYRLLCTLAEHPGKVMTHNQLLKEVWGEPFQDQIQYLRVYMVQLRRKIELDPVKPEYILTEVGVGYRMTETI
jgi:two-component system, OmpR family, KDP operon response regulator KdpE